MANAELPSPLEILATPYLRQVMLDSLAECLELVKLRSRNAFNRRSFKLHGSLIGATGRSPFLAAPDDGPSRIACRRQCDTLPTWCSLPPATAAYQVPADATLSKHGPFTWARTTYFCDTTIPPMPSYPLPAQPVGLGAVRHSPSDPAS